VRTLRTCRGAPVAAMVGVSCLIHGALYAAVERAPMPRRVTEAVSFEVVAPPPSPRPASPEPVAAAEEQKAVPRAPVTRPRRPKLAKVVPALPPALPPPNALPPPDAKPSRTPPAIRVGISLSSTVGSGGFAVGVGNTLHGKAEEVAADPTGVTPDAPGPEHKPVRHVPATRVRTLPRLLEQPKPEYTEQARKAEVEGQVILLLEIDERGRVTEARVLEGLGYGLDEVAAQAARSFRFEPATSDGGPVATSIRFTYSFVLE